MMKEPKIWTEDFAVRFHEVNALGHPSILAICHFLQSAASNHAQALGISVRDLRSSGHMWVLARLKLHIDNYPWGTDISGSAPGLRDSTEFMLSGSFASLTPTSDYAVLRGAPG